MKDKFGKLVKYFKETRAETKKVVWPDRRYITVATIIILVLVSLTGLYVMLIDYAFVRIFGYLMK
jgi:preprotein translocase subunit SecE